VIKPSKSPFRAIFSLLGAFVAVCALSLTGCRDKAPPPVVLAQVDQVKLTLGELRESFPAEYEKVLPASNTWTSSSAGSTTKPSTSRP
jgi:hypothetical protein